MKWKAMVAQLANRINQPHVIDLYMRKVFEAGKNYRDRHPAWIMCDDKLPDKPCPCVCHDGECMFFAEWVDDTKQGGLSGWSINGLTAQPIAWLPIPKFNCKAEGECLK